MAPLEPTCSRVSISSTFFLLALLLCSFCRGAEAARPRPSALDSPASSGPRGRPFSSSSSRSGRLLVSPLRKNQGTSDGWNVDSADYQADMPWQQQEERLSKSDQSVTDRLIKMDPMVECTSDAMKLRVHDVAFAPRPLIFVDRGGLSPLPLSVLPPSCGYSVGSSPTNVILVAPYHGCFVTFQEDSYALALLWWGLAMTMTCPLTRATPAEPPMVTCHPQGMMVKTKWTTPLSNVKINVTGQWELLSGALSKCGISVTRADQGVLIHVPYGPCVYKKDETYTLGLAGEQQGETKVSCPAVVQDLPKAGQSPTGTESRNVGLPHFHHFPSHPGTTVAAKKPFQRPSLPENDRPQNPASMPPPLLPDNDLPSYLFPYPPDGPVQEPTATPSPGRFQPPRYPQSPKPDTGDKTLPSVPPPKRPIPEERLAVGEKPYYPFLPNPWPEKSNDPGQDAGGPGTPTYPQVPEPGKKPGQDTETLPSGPLNKPYPFLPDPGKKPSTDTDQVHFPQPGQGGQLASPTQTPQLPEARTVGTGRVRHPYLFTFPPDPEKEPKAENTGQEMHPLYPLPDPKERDGMPSGHPQKPDVAPGPVARPPVPYPTRGTKEPVLKPKNPEVVTGKVPQSHYRPDPEEATRKLIPEEPFKVDKPQEPYQYPLFPVPGLGEATRKPMSPPQKPANKPAPHPPYAMPASTGKPMIDRGAPEEEEDDLTDPDPYGFFPEPEETPDEVNKVSGPHPPHPLFPMPAPEKNRKNPEVPTGKVQPANPDSYPAYPRPKEAGKKPVPETWPVKPQMPVPPPGPYRQPSHPYPYPPYSKPLPKPRPNKPKRPQVVSGQLETPQHPYPQYPRPGPQEPGKRPAWKPREPATPPFQVEQPLWFDNKVVGKPAGRNPYLVYPTPSSGELPEKPKVPGPEASGHVQPPNRFDPLPVGSGPERDVPAKVDGPPEPPTPVNPDGVKQPPEKDFPLVEETAKMVHPPWRQPVPDPPLLQGSKTGSKMACARFCTVGFTNCCPQITFHQHVYLSPAAPADKLTRVLSRQLPFGPPVAYYRPARGGGGGSISPVTKAAEEAGVPAKQHASQQHADGRPAPMAGSYSKSVALPETWSEPHLLQPHAPYSRRPSETNPYLTGSQLSDHVRPFVVQNPSPEARSGLLKDPAGPDANPMGAPRGVLFGPVKRPGAWPPHDMLNDAEAPKNTSFPWDFPRGSRPRMRERTGPSESKGYVLLHRGPPGKEPRGLAGSQRDQNFPASLRRGMGNVGFPAAAADRGGLPKWTPKLRQIRATSPGQKN
ncbi:uncharacterized protein LOC144085565 [Stigmatopora argus]